MFNKYHIELIMIGGLYVRPIFVLCSVLAMDIPERTKLPVCALGRQWLRHQHFQQKRLENVKTITRGRYGESNCEQ